MKYSYTIKKYIVHLCDAHFNHLLVQPLSLEEKKHNSTNLAVFFKLTKCKVLQLTFLIISDKSAK